MTTKRETKDAAVVLEYVLIMFAAEECGGDGSAVQEIQMSCDEYLLLKDRISPAEPAIDEPGPDWLETPDCTFLLGIWIEGGEAISETSLTRAQYDRLKRRLAEMRSAARKAAA